MLRYIGLLSTFVLLSVGNCDVHQHCTDSAGKTRQVLEEWAEPKQLCVCNYPEKYMAEPPPFSEFSPPEALCRPLGCVDRYTEEFKPPGGTMFNLAHNVVCTCVEGPDPYMMDQGLLDLYHWNC